MMPPPLPHHKVQMVKWVLYLGNMSLLNQMVSSYFNLLITLLIYIDLDDAPLASPHDSDASGEMGDYDAMMVDDTGE
jgi:hypothetical protein